MLTEQESRAIELSRFVAMVLIVSCHVLQAYDNVWAFVFNVGVQMFFLLSGYLYGAKDELEWRSFFLGRIKKVYLPYVVFLSVVVPCLVFGLGVSVTWKQIGVYLLNVQAFGTPVEGLNHLWFLTILMIGYLITPGLRWLWKKNQWMVVVGLVLVCAIEYGYLQKMYANFTWVMVYILGLLLGLSGNWTKVVAGLIALCGFAITIWMLPDVGAVFVSAYQHVAIWLHVFLAVVLIGCLYPMANVIIGGGMEAFALCNKMSYEIYLVHHVFCLRAASLLFLTEWKTVNVIAMILVTILVAWTIRFIVKKLNRLW